MAGSTHHGKPIKTPKQAQAGRKFTGMMLGTLNHLAGTLLNGFRSAAELTVALTD